MLVEVWGGVWLGLKILVELLVEVHGINNSGDEKRRGVVGPLDRVSGANTEEFGEVLPLDKETLVLEEEMLMLDEELESPSFG